MPNDLSMRVVEKKFVYCKGNYANRWKMLEDKKLSAVKEIFELIGTLAILIISYLLKSYLTALLIKTMPFFNFKVALKQIYPLLCLKKESL